MESSGDQNRESQDGKSRRRKRRRKKQEGNEKRKKKEERTLIIQCLALKRVEKKKKRKKKIEVSKVAEEWEIGDKEEEVAKLETEARKLVPEKFYK